MGVEDKGIEKIYSVYVSDFHLEMILIPFIKNKIDKNEDVIIQTEYDLENTLETLLPKINLKEEDKKQILNLGWNHKNNEVKIKNDSNIIVIGNKEYINDVNEKINQENIRGATVVDCYKADEVKEDINNIINNYNKGLTTNIL